MRRRLLSRSPRPAAPRGRTRLTGAALALALLAGCGSAGDDAGGGATGEAAAATQGPATPSPAPTASPGADSVVPEGRCEAPDPDETASNAADVTFLRGMIPHHEQAVVMSESLLAAPGVPADVVTTAEAIIAAQGPEIEEMTVLLEGCGGDVPVDVDDHAAHGHGSDDGISGMLTAAELDALAQAEGADAARLYLEHMIAHHEGAVAMARAHGAEGAKPEVLDLSERIVADQEAEIDHLEELLAGL